MKIQDFVFNSTIKIYNKETLNFKAIKQLGIPPQTTNSQSKKRPRIDGSLNIEEAKQLLAQKNTACITLANQTESYETKEMQKLEELDKTKKDVAALMARLKELTGAADHIKAGCRSHYKGP